jgi:hypothetical protein
MADAKLASNAVNSALWKSAIKTPPGSTTPTSLQATFISVGCNTVNADSDDRTAVPRLDGPSGPPDNGAFA